MGTRTRSGTTRSSASRGLRLLLGVVGVLGAVGAAASASAQGLRGTVREAVSDLPVPGAIIVLLDSAGTTLVRGLTDGVGSYRVPMLESVRRLRVMRIGYRPYDVPLLASVGIEAILDVRLERVPSLLLPVTVRANPLCPRRSDAERAFGLWEQTRAGLLATVVAREAVPARKLRIRYDQDLSADGSRILRNRVRLREENDTLPSFFAARSAVDFARLGFMEVEDGHRTFFGPDAEVLLDDDFLMTYCLQLARPERGRPRQVGLAFSPAKRHEDNVEIDGVIWIDTATRSLHDITFRYLGLERGTDRLRPGGTTSFLEMTNGVVLIDRWQFRLVGTRVDSAARRVSVYVISASLGLTGGELARASWPDGTEWRTPLGTLYGQLIGRDGAPAAGVPIALDDTDYLATSDTAGIFAITDLVPGPYEAVLPEPRLGPLNLRIPLGLRFTAVRDSIHPVRFLVPTLEEYVVDRCTASRQFSADDSTFVLGRVFREDGSAVEGARVTFSVGERGGDFEPVAAFFTTGAAGIFQSCHTWYVPGRVVRVSVRETSGRTTAVDHAIISRLSVLRVVVPR